MKTAGVVLIILGVIGTVIFGIHVIQDSEAVSLFGLDIAVSKANWTPLIISAAVLVSGIFITRVRRKR